MKGLAVSRCSSLRSLSDIPALAAPANSVVPESSTDTAASAAAANTTAPAKDAKDAKKAGKVAKKGPAPKKVLTKKWTIDCSEPVNDDIFDINAFEKFLKEKIKVAGKAGALGDNISVAKDANSITVTAKIAFSKRYLKYLTKKFLKQQQLRDYIRVIARQKDRYFLKYFNFAADDDEAADS